MNNKNVKNKYAKGTPRLEKLNGSPVYIFMIKDNELFFRGEAYLDEQNHRCVFIDGDYVLLSWFQEHNVKVEVFENI